MKITIINPFPDEEEEIIIKCRVLTEDINHLICKLKNGDRKITGYDAKGITLLALPDIFYFEATDNKVFAYGQKNVYEVKEKLYQLEEQLVSFPFMRASKSMILNLDKIRHCRLLLAADLKRYSKMRKKWLFPGSMCRF